MKSESSIARYRRWYRKLLRLHSKAHRERFAEGMEQTFADLLRERARDGRALFSGALWMFCETGAGILRENIKSLFMRNTNILRMVVVTACILMIPYVGNFPWDLFDYLVAGVLLLGTGLAYEFASKRGNRSYRFAVGIAVAAALMIVWGNLAVGFIGNENHPANLMYGGVLAIGIIGAIMARFRAAGMARALIATAVAQALVPVIALIIWRPPMGLGVIKVFVFNGFFVALFVVSAFLFHRSAATTVKAA